MRRSVLMLSTLSAWAMALAYDYIERISGAEVTALLCAAIMTMIFGFYAGLYANSKQKSKEEV